MNIELHKIKPKSFVIRVQHPDSELFDFAVIDVDGITAYLHGWSGADPDWQVASVVTTMYPHVEYLSWYRVSPEKLRPHLKRIDKMDGYAKVAE